MERRNGSGSRVEVVAIRSLDDNHEVLTVLADVGGSRSIDGAAVECASDGRSSVGTRARVIGNENRRALEVNVESIAVRAGIAVGSTCASVVGRKLLVAEIVRCEKTTELSGEASAVTSGRIPLCSRQGSQS